MKFQTTLRTFLNSRQPSNAPAISPPLYVISIALIAIGFLAYIVSGAAVERPMRYSSLAASACGIMILLLQRINPGLARWATGVLISALVFALASIWKSPGIFTLLVIPVFLSALLGNLAAVILTAGLQTLFLVYGPAGIRFDPVGQNILLSTIWLTAVTAGGGSIFYKRIIKQASDDYGRLQGLLSQSRDQQQHLSFVLEDLEHANRQLALLYDKNIALRKSAEEATEAKSTYIARVSHEIRTPLNMVLGITESIIENQEAYEDELPLDLVDDIKVIRRNSEHLLSLVNDVLDLTRAETSRMILRREWTDIGFEIEKSLEIVQPLARKKKLNLRVNTTGKLPEVYCDRTRIRQVILNLLSNAVRYTDHGEVVVHAFADERWLTIEVKDTGPGIESGDLEKVFEPFYRGSSGVKQETAGTGLGLSVCRQLIDLHGGKTWLESQPGEGCSFFFRLPVTLSVDPGASPARFINEQWVWVERKREREQLYNFQNLGKRRVVIFGSNDVVTPKSGELLEQVEIIPVESIASLAQEVSNTPAHMVVINVAQVEDLLPSMQQAASLIQNVPIIGSTFSSPGEQVQRSGAIDYLQKPFSNQRLRQAVEQIYPYPRKILVVDDNVEVQRLIVRILSSHNETTQYLLAEDGKSALEVARRKSPDLVLLDLALPEMDGWQVLKAMKEDPSLSNVPVILISAHDFNETPVRSKAVILMDGEGISLEKFHDLLQSGI